MTTIMLNGESTVIDDDSSIGRLLTKLNLENKRLAVEVNQDIIPHSRYDTHILAEQDKVEIVQAIGGG